MPPPISLPSSEAIAVEEPRPRGGPPPRSPTISGFLLYVSMSH
ncbi:hypothetical protein VB691_04365 [Crocosphaera sp. XPORK-15E]|nr:hypothetical protein [Crocosphaera sp. XPORK-15E]